MILSRHYWSLIWYQSLSDLRAEAAKGFLGILWWVLEPVLYMAAFYVVFTVLKQREDDAVQFLLSGLVVWKWFAGSVGQGTNSIIKGAGLMRQVYIPKFVFPCVSIVSNTFKFLIVFLLLLLFLFVAGTQFSLAWFTLPLLLVIEFLFVAAVVTFVAAITPFLPDVKVVINNLVMLMFFLSGVIFDISKAPDELKFYLYLNPMTTLVEDFRLVLLEGVFPEWQPLVLISTVSILGLVGSGYILTRFDRVYPKRILR